MLRWLIRCLIIILALLAALWVAALYRERDVSVPAGTAYFQTPLGRVAGRISGPRGGAPC